MVKEGKIIVGGQESGWIDQPTFGAWCKWFVMKIEKLRKDLKLEGNALLIMDGHNSRQNVEAIKFLKESKVTVIILPDHSTHVLQPLDISIFSPFKKFLTKNKKRYLESVKLENNNGYSESDIKRFKMVLLVLDSLQQSCIKLNIINGFQKSGIFPWNKEEPLNNKRIINDSNIVINLPTKSKQKRVNINGLVLTGNNNLNELIKAKQKKGYYKGNWCSKKKLV